MGTWRCRRRRTYTLLTCDNPSDLLRPPLTSCLTYCLVDPNGAVYTVANAHLVMVRFASSRSGDAHTIKLLA